jgi:hypothetical protein
MEIEFLNDTTFGYLLIGIALVVVLGLVFVIASRGASGPAEERPHPPRGVHLPGPSFLPVLMSLGAATLGAGFVFRNEDQVANLFILVPGLLILVAGVVFWIRAANTEWRDTERSSHDDGAAH